MDSKKKKRPLLPQYSVFVLYARNTEITGSHAFALAHPVFATIGWQQFVFACPALHRFTLSQRFARCTRNKLPDSDPPALAGRAEPKLTRSVGQSPTSKSVRDCTVSGLDWERFGACPLTYSFLQHTACFIDISPTSPTTSDMFYHL